MREPLIIVGAGRSGTNALRDVLTSLNQFHTWPCDEINYIWRFGNRDHPNDELKRTHATAQSCVYIRKAFRRRAEKQAEATLVEKTCATSLRVEFVDEVFPHAKFVHITRDARDVVSSAMQRWTAPFDPKYLARKARFVPRQDLAVYAARYLSSRVSRASSQEARLSTWGPRFAGLDELVRDHTPLHLVCSHQWVACVQTARSQLAEIDPERIVNLTYTELVTQPEKTLKQIVELSGESSTSDSIRAATSTLHASSLGAWRTRLTDEMVEDIDGICGTLQQQLGFT